MKVEITQMTLNDFYQIENCLLEEFDDFWTTSILKQELENKQNLNSHYFVAKIQNTIVGFSGTLMIIDEMNIMNIVVRKTYRKLGIGTYLLNAIIQFANLQNASCITLEVNEKNISAICLYKKFNFKQIGIRKKYYNNTYDAIIMQKSLCNCTQIK